MNWLELVATVCGATLGTPELAHNIDTVATKYQVDRTLILSVVWGESRCKPTAHGKSDDRGLMQVVPKWHGRRMARLGVTNLFDPLQNLRTGTDFLSALRVTEDPARALAIYNGGFTPPPRSYSYANSVLLRKKEYDSLLMQDKAGS
jgi:soluble lytic murein transglycosylase-like protein